jgi:acetyltransferase-like isoleucine patch superfamily enzyme
MKRGSHGTGIFSPPGDLIRLAGAGRDIVFEHGVLIFHPENVTIGDDVYVGHRTILKGYHKGRMIIGRGTWIGSDCFFHSAGDILIGEDVGIGPCVKILTSAHRLDEFDKPILHAKVDFAPVTIGDGADIGVGAILLPGVTIGAGAQIGAGAVVTSDVPAMGIASGVPARVTRLRTGP